jgi:hypothetical protein
MISHLFPNIVAGGFHTWGLEPIEQGSRATGDYTRWKWGDGEFEMGKGALKGAIKEVGPVRSIGQGFSRYGFPAATIGFSAAAIYQGWQDDGLYGAYQAGIWDLAMNTGYVTARGVGGGAALQKFRLGGIHRLAGAAVGATIGQAIGSAIPLPFAGTIGAFAGGAVGAAPLATMARHPLATLGAAGIAVGVGAAYGGAHLLKMGRAHAASKRSIHTDGSMAAFMTEGAFTMRQRAVSAMAGSHQNARSAFGQEAQLMRQPLRNYHSRYRM